MKLSQTHQVKKIMNSVKVSILVPVYKAEKYMERCARSLFGQTYDNLEFVFVDDCTPDRSVEILKSVLSDFPHRREQTKIINHDRNRGVAAARNTLLANATGDYLLWVDADDFIAKDAADVLVNKVIENDADIICFGTVVHTVSGDKPLALFDGTRPDELIKGLLDGRILTVLWGNLIRRRLFTDNNVSFIEGWDIGEDMLALVKVVYFSKTISVEQSVLYYYDNTNENSLVRSFSIEKTIVEMHILDSIEVFLKGKIEVSKYIKEKKLDAYLSIIYGACLKGDKIKYKWARAIIRKNEWKHIKSRKSSFYTFFRKCNSFSLSRMWAYLMSVLKYCVVMKKRIIKRVYGA